jgi:hypothetical protein
MWVFGFVALALLTDLLAMGVLGPAEGKIRPHKRNSSPPRRSSSGRSHTETHDRDSGYRKNMSY